MSAAQTAAAAETLEVAVNDAGAACRSTLYRAFSHAFAFPAPAAIEKWRGEDITVNATGALAGLPYEFTGPAHVLPDLLRGRDAAHETLAATYTALFDNCRGKPSVSIRESDYVSRDTKSLWEELIRFYEYFGLEFNLEKQQLWPDHLTVQLDAMHYLTFIEAGRVGDTGSLRHAERDFLELHLCQWTGPLAAALAEAPDAERYAELAAWLRDFVAADLAYLRAP